MLTMRPPSPCSTRARPAPLALFEIEERDAVAPAACGGVVDEEVYSPELASGFVYEAVAVVRLGDVDDEGESTVA